MADTINLTAEAREEFGKGASRRIRRQHKIPAVLYGRGEDPIHITLPGHDTMLALRQANALLSINLPGAEEKLALPKQVQRHPVRNTIEHVDLLIVRRGERVIVAVPVVLTGEPVDDVLVNQDLTELNVSAEATSIPAQIEVSIEGLEIGAQVLAGDVALPEGVELQDDPDSLIVSINPAIAVETMLETGEEEEAGEVEETEEQDAESAAE
ncbi:MAG: 50S ribosomal protein L25/general stress protein Ctc [Brooklawnia sp.]|uniref:50S ribosomal protein L25/general stress protein Ctc n=1 Tax=Brooklawnia sp. TaxID=2699740 RepID=UPI003C71666D